MRKALQKLSESVAKNQLSTIRFIGRYKCFNYFIEGNFPWSSNYFFSWKSKSTWWAKPPPYYCTISLSTIDDFSRWITFWTRHFFSLPVSVYCFMPRFLKKSSQALLICLELSGYFHPTLPSSASTLASVFLPLIFISSTCCLGNATSYARGCLGSLGRISNHLWS